MTRYLVARGLSTSLRFALPPLETLVLGRDAGCDIVIEEEGIAASHLEIYLDHGVGIRVNDADTARLVGEEESALEVGRTVDLEDGDRVRVGTVELSFTEVEEASVAGAHFVPEAFLVRQVADESRSGTVVRLRVTGGPVEELDEKIAEKARAGLMIARMGSRELGMMLFDAGENDTRDAVAPMLDHLMDAGYEVLVGFAHTSEGRDGLLDAAAKRKTRPTHVTPEREKKIVTRDPQMQKVVELVDTVAKSATPVLILGETGVGKDLVAQIIHQTSDRATGSFTRVSCVDLSDAFLEEAQNNFLARAKGGTVYLDELGGLSARAQLSLGYLLDDATHDVRIIASSNQDLAANVKKGSFRKDLFFRLNRLTIEIPPLRERSADIVPLAEEFVRTSPRARGRDEPPELSQNAKSKLIGYRWPGNVRELKNAIERAMLLCTGDVLDIDHLTTDIAGADTNPAAAPPLEVGERLSLRDEIAALEKRRILEALERYPTQRDAAAALDMPMRTFLNRLDAFGIPRARGGGGKKS